MGIRFFTKAHRGLTLIEILLATVLIVFGVVAVVKTMSVALSTSTYAEGQNVALALAQEKMEAVKDFATFASIDNVADAPVDNGTYAGYNREVAVTVVDASKLKQVTVNVTWFYKAQQITVSLVTLIANTFS